MLIVAGAAGRCPECSHELVGEVTNILVGHCMHCGWDVET